MCDGDLDREEERRQRFSVLPVPIASFGRRANRRPLYALRLGCEQTGKRRADGEWSHNRLDEQNAKRLANSHGPTMVHESLLTVTESAPGSQPASRIFSLLRVTWFGQGAGGQTGLQSSPFSRFPF